MSKVYYNGNTLPVQVVFSPRKSGYMLERSTVPISRTIYIYPWVRRYLDMHETGLRPGGMVSPPGLVGQELFLTQGLRSLGSCMMHRTGRMRDLWGWTGFDVAWESVGQVDIQSRSKSELCYT